MLERTKSFSHAAWQIAQNNHAGGCEWASDHPPDLGGCKVSLKCRAEINDRPNKNNCCHRRKKKTPADEEFLTATQMGWLWATCQLIAWEVKFHRWIHLRAQWKIDGARTRSPLCRLHQFLSGGWIFQRHAAHYTELIHNIEKQCAGRKILRPPSTCALFRSRSWRLFASQPRGRKLRFVGGSLKKERDVCAGGFAGMHSGRRNSHFEPTLSRRLHYLFLLWKSCQLCTGGASFKLVFAPRAPCFVNLII